MKKENIIIVEEKDRKIKWELVRKNKVELISIYPMIVKNKNE